MKQPLRALIVGVSATESESLCSELDRAGYDVVSAVVTDHDSMRDALDREKWDVILSEYSASGFACLAALELLKERRDDTPLLVVSDRLDAQMAIDAMRAGAHDFIPRGSPERLIASVERERTEARVRRQRRLGRKATQEAEARLQKALLESASRFRAVAEVSNGFIYEWDLEGGTVGWFGNIDEELGHEPGGFPRTREAWENIIHPEDRERVSSAVKRHLRTGEPFYEEYQVQRKDGGLLAWNDCGKMVADEYGNANRWIGVVTDPTSGRQAREKVKYLAVHDAVSGLPNRLLFNDRLDIALAQAKRTQQKLAVLFLDLDRFNAINESLGYRAGDQFLCQVGERIRGICRSGDTVACFGGDEFAILIQRLRAEEDAAKVAEKVLDAIRPPFSIDKRDFFITASVGASVYPSDGIDAETLSRNAEAALCRAKEHGRDNHQLYSPEMNARAAEHLSLENRLRQALQNEQLALHYQPVINLRTDTISGAEALIRWHHPDLGLLLPKEFIPLAERSGLIVPVGRWVLNSGCGQLRAWHDLGHTGLRIAVNVSPRQFQDPDFVPYVTRAIERSGVDPGSLDIEITESSAMQDLEGTIEKLQALKSAGVRISLDDFGTGFASLNHLRRFPLDRIKLDHSFVNELPQNPDHCAVARAVITMAHSLRLTIVGEGVETQQQLEFLRGEGCDEVQGFLFSPPLSSEDFWPLLQRAPFGQPSRPEQPFLHD